MQTTNAPIRFGSTEPVVLETIRQPLSATNGGKRIRIRERGATARAWSHARTTLGTEVPFEWSSIHGRGVGRPLDKWSLQLLGDYVGVFDRAYETAIPAEIASLYAIASGSIGHTTSIRDAASGWDLLPEATENSGRTMLGLAVNNPSRSELADASALDLASRSLLEQPSFWKELLARAETGGESLEAASRGLITPAH